MKGPSNSETLYTKLSAPASNIEFLPMLDLTTSWNMIRAKNTRAGATARIVELNFPIVADNLDTGLA